MPEAIRSFLAVEVSQEIHQSLKRLIDRLDLPQFHVRWAAPEKIHLTLRFLGDILPDQVADVSRAARSAAEGNAGFLLRLAGLGTFPPKGDPRIVWVGIEDDNALLSLENHLSRELTASGWPAPDKPFRPHLTLGRVKARQGVGELRRHIERNRDVVVGHMVVEDLALIKSVLRPSGPDYTVLDRFRLKKDLPTDTLHGGSIS